MIMTKNKWKLQELAKRILRKFGIEVARHYPNKDEYVSHYPYAYSTYAPWRTQTFLNKYSKVSDRTTVREDRCYILCQFVEHCLNLPGEFAECGVYRGASAYLISETMQKTPRSFHLFDTFKGILDVKGDPSGHSVGDFGDTSLAEVQKFLRTFPFVQYHPGSIPETFCTMVDKKFAFVHIDVDLYKSVLDCCSFFYERVGIGGIIVFDDYGFQQYEFSAKRAVDEFFKDRNEKPIVLHTGQCFVIKT